jgi:ferredoxin like protein
MTESVKARLGLDVYKVDSRTHIEIDHERCRALCAPKYCTFVCPAEVYTLGDDGLVQVEYDGCLECGTCLIACLAEALTWRYPRAGFGVQYRFG